jgi:two-component system response regulator YesN
MYRFLMVDDEEIVRRGFRRKIDWERLGFEFLEPCENGKQALEAIRTLRPDVVMTDIYMPHVDGLAVAAYAAEHFPEIVVVILSGYDEFEYAQKAIRSKVFEYVLKPVTSRDLTGLLGRLKERLDAERRSRRDESALKERAVKGDDLLRARSLIDMVSGARAVTEEADFQELFGFSPRGLACAAIVAEGDPTERTSVPAAAWLAEVVAAAIGSMRRVLAFSPGENREALIIFEPDSPSCARAAQSVAERIAAAAGFPATVGLSGVRENWIEVPRAFEEAAAALSYRLISGPGRVFRYMQAGADDPAQLAELKGRSERLCRAVVAGDVEESETRSAALFGMMEAALLSPQRVQHDIGALFAGVLDAFAQLGVSPGTVSRDLGMDYDLVVQRLRTAEEARTLLGKLAAYAGSILDARNLPAPEWKVRDFKDYVARHYGEKSLSVQTVAASLSISASYLSKLVKRHLDRSVIDYLTEYRMERAKELLATSDLMTYEIAEATGYPDARYFSSSFKRHVGVTPTEYRSERRRKTDRA